MVYQGKPSAGCLNCRKRKIKCDEATPACSQCINTKRTCPGYIPRFDLILRDQTKSVRRKQQKKKDDQKPSSPLQSVSSESSMTASTTGASAGSGGRSAHGIIRKARSEDGIRRIFNDFPEQQAICAFFLDFVLLPRHPGSVQGHLEHLLPLYQKTTPDSPLSLATSSVALVLSGSSQKRKDDRQLARKIFSKALQKVNAAIRNPTESKKDETLMAVLLLGLFEKIVASADASRPNMTNMHNAGAAALVMHRGADNVKTDVGVGLLFSVRSQLVESAIEEGISYKRCPDALTDVFRSAPKNAAAHLTSATVNVADLRSSAKSALLLPKNTESEKEVSDLLEYAISVDLLIATWPQSLPEDWNAKPSDRFDYPFGDVPKSTFVYDDKMDVYLDLWVQSIWNQYRSARINVQKVILDCISWLGTAYEHQWYWRAMYAKMIIQEMADEICGSVPFALGTKMSGGPGDRNGVEFPHVGGQTASEDHRRAASALGGWHLLRPLRSCLGTDYLRDGQKDWIIGQMQRISRIYALQPPKDGGEAVSPFNHQKFDQQKFDQQLQRYEFDCPS